MDNSVARMDWPNLFLVNGVLCDEDGDCVTRFAPIFASVEAAEEWLQREDIRGSVQAGRPHSEGFANRYGIEGE